MSKPNQLPERVTRLEHQMAEVSRKTDDALTLARSVDRENSGIHVRLRAHEKALNALRETQVEGFTRLRSELHERFGKVDERFSKVDDVLATVTAGQAHITALLTAMLNHPDKT